MRNQRVVLIALVLLLLLGGAAAVYFLVFDSPDQAQGNSPIVAGGNEQANNPTPRPDPTVDRPANNTPDKPGPTDPLPKPEPDKPDPLPKPDVPVPPRPDQPDQPLPEVPDTTNWPVHTTEHTIKGKIIYKSDGRPAVGAAITAEFNANPWTWGERDGNPKPPDTAAKVEGSTTSDGAGEFTLVVKFSRKVHPSRIREEGEKRDIAPEDDRDGGWGGGWGESLIVVGRMAGYAPARSGAIWLGNNADTAITLSLAVPAALTGRVIDAVSRKGIADATVSVYQSDAGSDGWTAPRTARTDTEGYFSFNDLGAGMYMYSANAAGYTEADAMSTGRRIDLTKGGEQNLGDIALLPAAGLSGLVVDAQTGKPVAGANVELEQASSWGRMPKGGGSTDAEGKFLILNIGAGSYSVRASAADYAPTTVPSVAAEAGKTTDMGVIKLGRGFSLKGKVVDGSGGVAGANISLNEPGPSSMWGFDAGGRALGTATSASDGSFTISGLSETAARIAVTAEGYAQLSEKLDLKSGMSDVTLRLFRGVKIIGRVQAADGTPAAGISVGVISHADGAYNMYKLQPENLRWFGSQGGVSGTTGQDGRFVLERVPPQTYLFAAYPSSGKPFVQDDIRVTESGDIDLGDIRLPGPGNVRVTVTEGGQPVSGLKVEIRTGMGMWVSGSETHPSAETDGLGVAQINDVPAGEAYVMTSRDKDQWDTEILQKRRVLIKTGQTVDFKLELKPSDSARLHGRATLDSKPSFSEIMLLGVGDKSSFFKQAKPDEAGFYEFPAVPMGSYVMHFRVGDKVMSSIATLTVDKPGELEFSRNFDGHSVSGVVSTPNNTAAERASVKIAMTRLNDPTPEAYTQWLKAETGCDADGRFRLDHVSAGTYRLTASLDGVGSISQDITVSAGDVSGITLALANNSGTLRVIVKKLTGTPLSAQNFGLVQLRDASGTVLAFDNENAGFFMPAAGSQVDLTTVPSGTYTLVLNTAGFLPLEKTGVTITTGNRTDVEVELTAAAELHLTFTNTEATQELLATATLRYFDAQGNELPRHSSPFDAWSPPPATETPLLRARYIGPNVTQVKVKIQGFAELVVNVEFEAGKKIQKQETLVAG